MLNIPSTVNDPKYRYRMPKMQLKIESKGNGIKTNIVNLGEVAKHLRTN
jgi:translation initiation factor 5